MRSKEVDEDHVEEHVRYLRVIVFMSIDQRSLDDEGEGDSRFSVERGSPSGTRGRSEKGGF